jgi:hypothetical protein
MPRAHLVCTGIVAGLLMAGSISLAAPGAPAKPPQQKPYRAVAVSLPPAPADPRFAAFRHQLAAVAKSRVYAQLVGLVAREDFFWDGDFSGGFDPQGSSAENLAAAVRLESDGGSGWKALAAFAAIGRATRLPSHPGVVCVPPEPDYDFFDFDQLLSATGTHAADWRYPREDAVALRAAPRPTAPLVEVLGLYFVRRLEAGTGATAQAARAPWLPIAAPSGRTGYAAAAMLLPLRGDRLCYSKDVMGRWQIAGYITARR